MINFYKKFIKKVNYASLEQNLKQVVPQVGHLPLKANLFLPTLTFFAFTFFFVLHFKQYIFSILFLPPFYNLNIM